MLGSLILYLKSMRIMMFQLSGFYYMCLCVYCDCVAVVFVCLLFLVGGCFWFEYWFACMSSSSLVSDERGGVLLRWSSDLILPPKIEVCFVATVRVRLCNVCASRFKIH